MISTISMISIMPMIYMTSTISMISIMSMISMISTHLYDLYIWMLCHVASGIFSYVGSKKAACRHGCYGDRVFPNKDYAMMVHTCDHHHDGKFLSRAMLRKPFYLNLHYPGFSSAMRCSNVKWVQVGVPKFGAFAPKARKRAVAQGRANPFWASH